MELRTDDSARNAGAPCDAATAAEDALIVAAAITGAAGARDQLVARLVALPAMLRAKNAKWGAPLRPHELEDATQNALLAIWQKLDRYDGRSPLLHWAYGFGVVEIRRAVERRGRRRELGLAAEEVPAPFAAEDLDRERLRRCCAEVEEPDRSILRQKHTDGATFDEIAARLVMPVNTVKTRYYRVLERLRQRLRASQEGRE